MKYSIKRFCAFFLTALLLVSAFPAAAPADEADGKPAVSLEQAINTVKENFIIPQEYLNFSSSYNRFDGRQSWSLNWNSAGEPGGSFNAQVDAGTGEIIDINNWKPVPPGGATLQAPAVSREKARQVAIQYLNKLAREHLSELQPVNEDSPASFGSYSIFNFHWQRVASDIPFPGNGVTIGIRAGDGTLVSYNLNWSKAVLPGAAGAISPDRAREAFDKAGMLKLQYFLPPKFRPLMQGKKQQVLLVYRLTGAFSGAIDALTGEPLKADNGQWLQNAPGGGGGEPLEYKKAMSSDNSAGSLTPEELNEIQKTAKAIGQDDAVAAVRKWVDLPAGLNLRSANLTTDWQSPSLVTWNLNWSAESTGAEGPQFFNARVNALTGELIEFDMSKPPSGSAVTVAIGRDEARQKAEEFLKQVQPQRFSETILDDSSTPSVFKSELKMPLKGGQGQPGQFSFSYTRIVDGIPFQGSNISVTVDAAAGRIINYNLNWPELDFPGSQGALDAGQALDAFLKNHPLALSYVQFFGPDGPGEVRLAYLPRSEQGMPDSNIMMDAKTGELLDWQGKPLSSQPRIHQFNDIASNPGAKEISLLGQAGLFGEYGDSFHPDENVTAVALLRAMLASEGNLSIYTSLNDQQVISQAKDRGWLKEVMQPGDPVSREMLAKLMVRLLNLDRAARAEGIYQVPYTDVPQDSLGYAALARGLGIIAEEGTLFKPELAVTRAEAAVALARALEARP